ncbi:MAG: nucleotidyltransferase family protein [Lachnospiraceae bacterium]
MMSERDVINSLKQFKLHEQLVLLCSRYQLGEIEQEYLDELIGKYDIDWPAFLGNVMLNRVNGVVFRNIENNEGIPDYVHYFLKIAQREQRERTCLQQEEIKKISDVFEKEHIRYSFLKGAVMNKMYYQLGERISNDTDIMIHIEDIDKAVELLKELGYIQGKVVDDVIKPATKKEILFARLNTYEIVSLVKAIDERYLPFHEVDINFKLSNDDVQEKALLMLDETVILSGVNAEIRTLSLERFFIFLCIHHYREATMILKIAEGDDLQLYKFMDIHFMISQKGNEMDWNKLLELCVKMGRLKDVYYTMYYTEILYPGTFRSDILKMFEVDDKEYLNEYKGRDNSDEVYKWEKSFVERVFSCTRRLEAMKNIEAENKRYHDICKQLSEN